MSNYTEILNDKDELLGHLPISSEGGRLRNIVYMSASGTYEKPAWLKFVRVRGVGGGGGGGGVASTAAAQKASSGGGGGGGCFEKRIVAADLAASETVTVGSGGAGGAAGNNAGATGGATSFGAHCSATGGTGASGCAATADTNLIGSTNGLGGTASGGDINSAGAPGGRAQLYQGQGFVFGFGGPSLLSVATSHAFQATGITGSLYGAGGGGVYVQASQAAQAGGTGAPGIVVIEEYE